MITNLTLTNFKKHESASFDFGPGLNGIFGPNYAGKTSILYGILYALGGASQVPGTNLLTKGCATGMRVQMSFTLGDRSYRVDRKSNGAYLYEGEDTIATGTSNVTAEIERLLGMSVKQFKQLRYAEQKKAHALLTLGASHLHKIIDSLTGVDDVDVALDRLRDIHTSSNGAIEALTPAMDLEALLDLKTATAEEAARQIILLTEFEGAKEEAEAALRDARVELVVRDGEYDRYLEASSNLEVLNTRLGSLISQRDSVREQSAEVPENVEFYEEEKSVLEDVTERSRAAWSEAEDRVKRRERYERERKKLISKVSERTAKLSDWQEKILSHDPDLDEKLISAQQAVEEANAAVSDAEGDRSRLHALVNESECPTCHRPMDGWDDEKLDSVNKKLELLDSSLPALRQNLEDCRLSSLELAAKYEEQQEEKRGLSTEAEMLDILTKELEEIEKVINSYHHDYILPEKLEELYRSNNREYLQARDNLKLRKSLDADLKALDRAIGLAGESIRECEVPEYDETLHKLSKQEEKDRVRDWERALQDWTNAKTKLQAAESEAKSAYETYNRASQREKEYAKHISRRDLCKTLIAFLRNNRDRYTKEVWDFFMSSASTFASACTSGSIEKMARTDKGKFEFWENESAMSIEDASGAQEAIMGLAVQTALSTAAHCPFDVLLVDEPTADMDERHSLAVNGVLASQGAQIIAISHREMDSSLCNTAITL